MYVLNLSNIIVAIRICCTSYNLLHPDTFVAVHGLQFDPPDVDMGNCGTGLNCSQDGSSEPLDADADIAGLGVLCSFMQLSDADKLTSR
jgi:hypothetical protein